MILARDDVKRLQRSALTAPFVGDGSEALDLLEWKRGGFDGAVALSFNR